MYEYSASVVKVVDGDTLHLNVDLGCDVRLKMTVRLADIDAPEISTNEGKVSKAFVEDWLESCTQGLTIKTVKDRREKYGRYLAFVYDTSKLDLVPEPLSLNEQLVNEGLAKSYTGGKRG